MTFINDFKLDVSQGERKTHESWCAKAREQDIGPCDMDGNPGWRM